MDLSKVLQQLYQELQNLDAAIESLERLQESGRRRRGGAEEVELTESRSTRRGRPAHSEPGE